MFKKKFVNYLIELSNIILGITIAFAINKWSEYSKIDTLEIKTLINIKSELKGNSKYLKQVLEANNNNIEQYNQAVIILQKELEQENYVFTNIKLLLEDTGYEMAVNLGVLNHLDFELARSISYCYKLQENIYYFEDDYFDHLKRTENTIRYYTQAINKLKNYNLALEQLIEQENNLLNKIIEFLKKEHRVSE